MRIPPLPPTEIQRIAALNALQILDTEFEERFDRFTRFASALFQVPIAVISLVDTNRQWFKSCVGLNVRETGRDVSFCGHTILQDEPLIIEDALLDERFFDNPLVTGAPFVRFYAGFPLSSPEGYKIGTLCLIDHNPRYLEEAKINTLRELAYIVQSELANLELILTKKVKEAAEQALVESESRYQTLVEVIREGIIVQDDTGQILTFNAAAANIFNLTDVTAKSSQFPDPKWKIVFEDGSPLPEELHPAMIALRTARLVSNQVLGICSEAQNTRWFLVNSQPLFRPGQIQPFQVVSSYTDITHRKEVEDRYRVLSNATFEGVIIISNEQIIEANQAMSTIFGYEHSELIGKNPQNLVINEAREEITRQISKDSPLHYEVQGLKKDSSRLILEIRSVKFLYKNQPARVAVIRDITERKELDRLKSEFISVVSHELRTPLTSIRGSLGLVVSGVTGEVNTQTKTMLDIAYKNSERLVRLINDILDIEKIEAGRMVFNMAPVELDFLVQQAVEVNSPYVEQLGVSLRLKQPPSIPGLKVRGDSDRLIQVLTNLISNSAKFSPRGECVDILVETTRETVRVNIIDRGPGIPEEFKKRIFQKFAQADNSDQRQKGGTGLGLSITKAIVESHGGRIGFYSGPDGRPGTTFFFEIPRLNEEEGYFQNNQL